jgi:hypothetical protein
MRSVLKFGDGELVSDVIAGGGDAGCVVSE